MKKIQLIAAVLIALSRPALGADPPGESDGQYERMKKGNALYRAVCLPCHGKEVPAGKGTGRENWEKTVAAMADNGAVLTAQERAAVVDYLVARDGFDLRCTACHDRERCLSRSKDREEWVLAVKKMGQRIRGGLEAGEVKTISAYLAVTCPPR